MGPHRKLGIYVGYQSPSIIKYLEPLTGDLFTAQYADCIFSEDHFPALGEEIIPHKQCQEINWDAIVISNHDPCTLESELQVQKIINLQHIANNTPDAFTDYKDVTKSYNPARNVPARVEVPNKTTQLSCTRERCKTIPTYAAPSKQKKKEKVYMTPSTIILGLLHPLNYETVCFTPLNYLKPSDLPPGAVSAAVLLQ
jgi:hypothetical protein